MNKVFKKYGKRNYRTTPLFESWVVRSDQRFDNFTRQKPLTFEQQITLVFEELRYDHKTTN